MNEKTVTTLQDMAVSLDKVTNSITNCLIILHQWRINNFANYLVGFYYGTFQNNLVAEPVCQKVVCDFLLVVEEELQHFYTTGGIKQITHKVDTDSLLNFLTKHTLNNFQNLEVTYKVSQEQSHFIEVFLVSSASDTVLSLVKIELPAFSLPEQK